MKRNAIINTIEKVKSFCEFANSFSGDVYVIDNKYTVNGKSLLGLFSITLTEPLSVELETEDIEERRRFDREISAFSQ